MVPILNLVELKKPLNYADYFEKIHKFIHEFGFLIVEQQIENRIVSNIEIFLGKIVKKKVIHYCFKNFGKVRKGRSRSVISQVTTTACLVY